MIVTLESERDPQGVFIDVALVDDGAIVVELVDLDGGADFDAALGWAVQCTRRELPAPPRGWRLRTL